MVEQRLGFAQPDQSPGFLLWRASTAWQRKVKEALLPFGLTQVQFVLLATTAWLVSEDPTRAGVNQTAIAELSGSDPNTVSATIKRMVAKGLLERTVGTIDARARIVKVSHQGLAVLAQAAPVVEAADKEFFAGQENAALLTKLNQTSRGLS